VTSYKVSWLLLLIGTLASHTKTQNARSCPCLGEIWVIQLCELNHPDIEVLIASIPGANTHDIPKASIKERAANLLTWVESGTGPGLPMVINTAQRLFPQLLPLVPPRRQHKHLPYARNIFFTGREDVLQRLHQALVQNRNAALTQAIA